MKLYICSTWGLADAASYDAASLKIDSHRRDRLGRIKSEKDRIRSICAGLLLNYAVTEYMRANADDIKNENSAGQEISGKHEPATREIALQELTLQELLNTEKQSYEYKQEVNGKPYIADMPGFHFSLSHSGDYVLCAWDRREIGADLQYMDREVKAALAKKVMTSEEYSAYVSLPVSKQREEFYRIWTIKESYCKLTGKGLSQDFREIGIDKISFQADLWGENYWLAVSHYE